MRTASYCIGEKLFRVEIEERLDDNLYNVSVYEVADEDEQCRLSFSGVNVIRRGARVEIVGGDRRISGLAVTEPSGDGEVDLDGTRYLVLDGDRVGADEESKTDEASPEITAPMPGRVVKVLVEEGAMVVAGDPLLIVESMKMESEVVAGLSGRVATIPVTADQRVNPGDLLARIEPAEENPKE